MQKRRTLKTGLHTEYLWKKMFLTKEAMPDRTENFDRQNYKAA